MRYIFIFLIIFCSCSQKAYVYRDGTKQGVNYKKAVSPSERKLIDVYAFLVLSFLMTR